MTISQKGIELIKKFEGFIDHIYICPAGKPTIGYGHVVLNSDSFPAKISEKDADILLHVDVQKFEQLVHKQVKVPLAQKQFDALVCFAFNTGCIGKTMLKRLAVQDYAGCAEEFDKWIFATVKGEKAKLSGLVTRRKAEKELFLS